MSSIYGENLKLSIFGQSHSEAVGMTLDGIPAGERIDMDALQSFMNRRAPGNSVLSTERKETDCPEFLSGIQDDTTCGAPITAILRNADARPGDYESLKNVPRPGHADYVAEVKYNGYQDYAGGGHFSGRLTAPLCIAGGICRQLLEREGIAVYTRILSIGGISDKGAFSEAVSAKPFPAADDGQGQRMQEEILKAKADGDSVGGVVQCVITGLPVGLGDPVFGGMENRISQAVFGIPAVKGIEFGSGFAGAGKRGSENNDAYVVEEGSVKTQTNHAGGILGGITNGAPIDFRVCFKPTPSIAKPQKSVNLSNGEPVELVIKGRHDPCIVPRALPCVEAAAAIAVYDALLGRRKETVR